MARGRHARPHGLLARLFPGRAARRRQAVLRDHLLRQLADELRHAHVLADRHAAAAADAERRAAAAQSALRGLRREVAELREEALWAWARDRAAVSGLPEHPADERPPARVIDLRRA